MNDEENQALAAHARKGKGRKFTKNTNRRLVSENKKDISKIRCYNYNQLGHYARVCTQENKKMKHHAHIADNNEHTSHNKSREASDEEYVLYYHSREWCLVSR